MNSNLAAVMAVYEGVIKDASHTWPRSIKSFGKDYSYLLKMCETRGLPFFTVLLPDLGRAIEQSLEHGSFDCNLVPKGIPLYKNRPKIFGDLFSKMFHEDGTVREDLDVNALLFYRQLCYLAKKLKIKCSQSVVERTLNEFFKTEMDLPVPYDDTWDSDTPVWSPRRGHPIFGGPDQDPHQESFPLSGYSPDRSLPWDTLGALARRVISEFGTPDWWNLTPKHGPGAVSESGCWKSKYDFPFWPRKLANWFPFDWFGSGILDSRFTPDDREPPSRLIAVPKTQKGPRLICAEPIAHQWIQQGIRMWIEGRVNSGTLKSTITFRSQDNSRERAIRSSLTREWCTIDLSSASDRLSCRLVEYIFQGSELLDGMHACRTRMLSQELSDAFPKLVKLRKFSTQGSALTFPVQSIVFAILATWAYRLSVGKENDFSDWKSDFRRVTVFGDDIIAPNSAYETITHVLSECGLKVNTNKSFSKGFFRESCGMDAYKGVNVTPAYLLHSYTGTPESTASLVETSNNFHKMGMWFAAEAVVALLPRQEVKILPIVDSSSGGLGLLSFCGFDLSHLRKKWCDGLHRMEYSVLTLTSEVDRVHGRDSGRLSQYYFEDPDPYFKWESGQAGRARVGKRRAWVFF